MTRARIWGATVFVYYASRWVKVHLMQDATGVSTVVQAAMSLSKQTRYARWQIISEFEEPARKNTHI